MKPSFRTANQNQSCSLKFPVAILAIVLFAATSTNGDENSKRLLKDLFSTNSPMIRPVLKHSDNVSITVGISLLNILEVNFVEKSLTTNLWISMSWKNPTLIWKPVSYNDIKRIVVPVSLFWSPDLAFYNDVTGDPGLPKTGNAVLNFNGQAEYVLPKLLKTYCYIEEKSNIHECQIYVGSWTHTAAQIDLQPRLLPAHVNNATDETLARIDLSEYLSAQSWTIESTRIERNEITRHGFNESPFARLVFTLRFSATKFNSCT